ncbi:hypothetical protein NPY00_06250, partial [Bartonella sp. F2]|nr:hypothetical protein [Bartonella sp. F02]
MIKIFKNHMYLCALTTALVPFLYNVTVSAQASSGVLNAGSLGSGCGDQKDNREEALDYCDDGQTHIIKGKKYQLNAPLQVESDEDDSDEDESEEEREAAEEENQDGMGGEESSKDAGTTKVVDVESSAEEDGVEETEEDAEEEGAEEDEDDDEDEDEEDEDGDEDDEDEDEDEDEEDEGGDESGYNSNGEDEDEEDGANGIGENPEEEGLESQEDDEEEDEDLEELEEEDLESEQNEDEADISLLSPAAVVAKNTGTVIHAEDIHVVGSSDLNFGYGIVAIDGGKVTLHNAVLEGVKVGLQAERGGIFEVNGGIIEAKKGVVAKGDGTSVFLMNTKIKVNGVGFDPSKSEFSPWGMGLASYPGAKIKMKGGEINATDSGGLFVHGKAYASLEDVSVTAISKVLRVNIENQETGEINEEILTSPAVFNIKQGGILDLTRVRVNATDIDGLRLISSFFDDIQNNDYARIAIAETTLKIQGDISNGLYFFSVPMDNFFSVPLENKEDHLIPSYLGKIKFENSTLTVPKGTAIYNDGAKKQVDIDVQKGSNISGNLLLRAEPLSSITIRAQDSSLTGGVRTNDTGVAKISLSDGSKWTLTAMKPTNSQNISLGSVDLYDSSLTMFSLSNSRLVFEKPTAGKYQALHIGQGKDVTEAGQAIAKNGQALNHISYSAEGDARVYVNA